MLTHLPWTLLVGMPQDTATRTFLMTVGWVIDVLMVELKLARTALKRGTDIRKTALSEWPDRKRAWR